MTTISHLREAKALLSANRAAEADKLIETTIYSLLDAGNRRQAARVNLVFLGRLTARQGRASGLKSGSDSRGVGVRLAETAR
jgi:hypothetical protein